MIREVLFFCVGNSCRSPMAEGLFNAAAPPGWRAISAGSDPAAAVNPTAVQAMAEVGIDIARHRPRKLTPGMAARAGRIISLCTETCPILPGRDVEPWGISDPVGQPLETYREVRDTIRRRVERLIEELSQVKSGEG